MRLQSVILRNIRVHRELAVEFDPSRTLIGGPNESGKSTLVEALHRALFLRAKGATESHRALVSTRHAGIPEVELRFEADGVAHHLTKRFGSTGVTLLSRAGAPALKGDEAEAELARCLGIATGGPRSAALAQWAHLWVWQGTAGTDPLGPANTQADRLLQRLQESGGAGALVSDRDARVAAAVAARHEALFTQAGKPRAGTEWAVAETDATEAAEVLARAEERRRQLDQAVRDAEAAARDLAQCDAGLPGLRAQRQALDERVASLHALRTREAGESAACAAAREVVDRLTVAAARIAELQAGVARQEAGLAPEIRRGQELAAVRAEAERRFEAAEAALGAAIPVTQRAREARDLARSVVDCLELAARHRELATRDRQIRQIQEEAQQVRQALAALPAVDAAVVKRLQKLDQAAATAEAAWRAMAAGIEVLAAEVEVSTPEGPLPPGEVRIVTEATEVRVGAVARLRIRPGGGTGFTEARSRSLDAREAVRAALADTGVPTVSAAEEVLTRRGALSQRLAALDSLLETLEAATVPRLLAEAGEALAAAEADRQRRAGVISESATPLEPGEVSAARNALAACADAVITTEAAEAARRAERDAARVAAAAATRAEAAHRAGLERQEQELAAAQSQWRLLRELHGEDPARQEALVLAQRAAGVAEAALAATRQALAGLQPDLVSADTARLERALAQWTAAREDATRRQAAAGAALRWDGLEDPSEAWALAKARSDAAARRHDAARRRALSVQSLHLLFGEVRQGLADQFTRPLAERVDGYLQCLFGADVRATLSLEAGEFRGLNLARGAGAGGTVPFDQLSGGTREQVAAAVRLAVAEILAADQGGTLPVIFDDAFAFSDPERIPGVQRLLDLAALRGLQVIVLSCTPSDYTALGARTVSLPAAV